MLTADSSRKLFAGRRVAEVYRGTRRRAYASAGPSGSTIPAVTAGGVSNTKGNYAELTSSAAIDADGFFLTLDPGTVSNRNFRVDIGVGPNLAETVILADLLATYRGNGLFEAYEVYVPLPIRRGTRIAARCQSNAASAVMRASVELVSGPVYREMRMKRATTFGTGASSGGTSIDPGGVANTKGSWVEFSSALPDRVRYLIVCVGNQLNAARSGGANRIDVGVGANPNEVVIVPEIWARMEGNRDGISPALHGRWVELQKGERLAVRAASQVTTSPARLFDVLLVGFGD